MVRLNDRLNDLNDAHAINLSKQPVGRGGRRSEDVHAAILRAADQLLSEKGYLGVTIEAIAARAGAGKQTIYRWWPSKADLYMELYAVLAARVMHPLDTGSVRGDLREMYRQLLTLFTTTGAGIGLAGLVAEAQSRPGFAEKLFAELVTKRRALWIKLLEKGRARGEVSKGLDLEFAVDLMSGPVWYRLLLGHAPLDALFADQLVQTLLPGLHHAPSRLNRNQGRAPKPSRPKRYSRSRSSKVARSSSSN
jgi:AcrR family transcriptional regulator